ncbi:MAG: hypothetical protein JXA49_08655 [Actinobacteria bacterium]|nr:hypothetical protein [Actinomycetota bacterium]
MNPLSAFWRNETVVFHLRAGGCGGCADVVDEWIRSSGRDRLKTTECVSPRHADIIIITGLSCAPAASAAVSIIEQAPAGCRIIVMGDCAAGCGPHRKTGEDPTRLDFEISFDSRIEGCPAGRQSIAGEVKRCLGSS